jgi:endonuclease G, mitochondrial
MRILLKCRVANNWFAMLRSLFILLLISNSVYGQTDTITIKHHRYSTTFDRTLHYPVLVHWLLTKSDLSCTSRIKRDSKMKPDPLLLQYTNLDKYYKKSGYDKGHNDDAAGNGCNQQDMHECFYFSNITPQEPNLNRSNWKNLETHTRSLALQNDTVEVWCGSYGFIKKIGIIPVPAYCWKILKYKGKTEAYIMPNTSYVSLKPYTNYISTIDNIRKATGLKLAEITSN